MGFKLRDQTLPKFAVGQSLNCKLPGPDAVVSLDFTIQGDSWYRFETTIQEVHWAEECEAYQYRVSPFPDNYHTDGDELWVNEYELTEEIE